MNKNFIIFIYLRFKKMWEELQNALDTLDFEKTKEIIEKNPTKIDEKVGNSICNLLQYICNICSYNEMYDRDFYPKIYKIVKLLLEFGADVNKKTYYYYDFTPLMFLCDSLIQNININGDDGEEIAKILELLLNYGANVNIKDKYMGQTPLHLLFGDISLVKYHRIPKSLVKIIKLLIENGADVNIESNTGKLAIEPFFIVPINPNDENSEKNVKEIIKIMLENGLNVDKIKQKYSPLKLLFTYHLENRIKELEKENGELRYKPGNPGYHEAMEDFDRLADVEKK